MKDAEKILRMIEEVDPADTGKLDEIDARVFCYINQKDPDELFSTGSYSPVEQWYYLYYCSDYSGLGGKLYTRSRDALKAIRPEGWGFNNYYHYKGGVDIKLHSCSAGCWKVNQWENVIFAEAMLTEEIAELHAIIQAIAYKRSQ